MNRMDTALAGAAAAGHSNAADVNWHEHKTRELLTIIDRDRKLLRTAATLTESQTVGM